MKWSAHLKNRRPWGGYRVLLRETGSQVKRIEIKPGQRFSLQKHLKRSEKWIILSGSGLVTLGSKISAVKPGDYIEVKKGQIHRLQSKGKKPLILIEVQFGNYLGEDDIVRFADDFGRA